MKRTPVYNAEDVFLDCELNLSEEYRKLKSKMENALGNIDPRMPREYIKRALLETINNFEVYQENIFPD